MTVQHQTSAGRTSSGVAALARFGQHVPGTVQVAAVWIVVGVVGANVLVGSSLFLGTTALIFVLAAMSTNILLGWTGITSFGQAAFFGAGAYAVGLVAPLGVPPLASLLVGAGVSGVLALLFSLVSNRVTGVEFAMLTLVFGEILSLLLYRIPALGGESGLPGIPRGEIFGATLFSDTTFWWYAIGVTGILAILIRRLRDSTLGASLTAVRDNSLRAAALGIDVKAGRVVAFTIAGLVAGIAGALYAQLQGIASPDVMSWTLSGEILVMCLIGGIYTYWGPAIGAVIFTVASWALSSWTNAPQLYFGLGLLVIVLVIPEGLLGLLPTVKRRPATTKELS
jgi:branched-chain amino acid transport system permease protein